MTKLLDSLEEAKKRNQTMAAKTNSCGQTINTHEDNREQVETVRNQGRQSGR